MREIRRHGLHSEKKPCLLPKLMVLFALCSLLLIVSTLPCLTPVPSPHPLVSQNGLPQARCLVLQGQAPSQLSHSTRGTECRRRRLDGQSSCRHGRQFRTWEASRDLCRCQGRATLHALPQSTTSRTSQTRHSRGNQTSWWQ